MSGLFARLVQRTLAPRESLAPRLAPTFASWRPATDDVLESDFEAEAGTPENAPAPGKSRTAENSPTAAEAPSPAADVPRVHATKLAAVRPLSPEQAAQPYRPVDQNPDVFGAAAEGLAEDLPSIPSTRGAPPGAVLAQAPNHPPDLKAPDRQRPAQASPRPSPTEASVSNGPPRVPIAPTPKGASPVETPLVQPALAPRIEDRRSVSPQLEPASAIEPHATQQPLPVRSLAAAPHVARAAPVAVTEADRLRGRPFAKPGQARPQQEPGVTVGTIGMLTADHRQEPPLAGDRLAPTPPLAPPLTPAAARTLTAPIVSPAAAPTAIQAQPDVIISIGRVEVRTPPIAPSSRPAPAKGPKPLSLADYLARRKGAGP